MYAGGLCGSGGVLGPVRMYGQVHVERLWETQWVLRARQPQVAGSDPVGWNPDKSGQLKVRSRR
jgi:hypothetical protein